jgi:hypothetical protein
MNNTSLALVIATYISLLSSSNVLGSSAELDNGNTFSSTQTINTTGNSSHLDECIVINFTASEFSSEFSMVSTIKVTSSKNHLNKSSHELTISSF